MSTISSAVFSGSISNCGRFGNIAASSARSRSASSANCLTMSSSLRLDQLVAALEDPADVLGVAQRADVSQRVGAQGHQLADLPDLQRAKMLVDLERLGRGLGGGDDRLHRRQAGPHQQAQLLRVVAVPPDRVVGPADDLEPTLEGTAQELP